MPSRNQLDYLVCKLPKHLEVNSCIQFLTCFDTCLCTRENLRVMSLMPNHTIAYASYNGIENRTSVNWTEDRKKISPHVDLHTYLGTMQFPSSKQKHNAGILIKNVIVLPYIFMRINKNEGFCFHSCQLGELMYLEFQAEGVASIIAYKLSVQIFYICCMGLNSLHLVYCSFESCIL